MIKCIVCNLGTEKGPLFRINNKGEQGKFSHSNCCQDIIEKDREFIEFTEQLHQILNEKTIH
jgi:hypothetical protein